MNSYLSDQSYFVQIDDRTSESVNVRFGVPQGSILGPMLFNLFVSDLQDHLPSSIGSSQYADDTTIYSSCPAPELQRCAQEPNSTLNTVSSWSNDSHLAFNSKKTKLMLLSTSQMSHVHSLDKNQPPIRISDSTLEYVNISRLLDVHFHQHLNWDKHVQGTCKNFYGTIQIIRKLNTFYYPLLEFQLKLLQRVQPVAASFVLRRYLNGSNDIFTEGWLPVRQRRDFHVPKLVHEALHYPSRPSYVSLDTVKHLRSLRSRAATRLIIPVERGTFQDSTAKFLMLFQQILETVAISKFTAGKSIPIY